MTLRGPDLILENKRLAVVVRFFFFKVWSAWCIGSFKSKQWALSCSGSRESYKLTCRDQTYLNTAAPAMTFSKWNTHSLRGGQHRSPGPLLPFPSLSVKVWGWKMWIQRGSTKVDGRMCCQTWPICPPCWVMGRGALMGRYGATGNVQFSSFLFFSFFSSLEASRRWDDRWSYIGAGDVPSLKTLTSIPLRLRLLFSSPFFSTYLFPLFLLLRFLMKWSNERWNEVHWK